MPDTEMGKTWIKLSLISEHAKRDSKLQFTSLAHLLNKEFLIDCYRSLNRKKAVGVDKVSWEEYGEDLDGNIEWLVERLKRKSYKPKPAKRVYIPKGNGETRPLGISALENKIVEKGITQILSSIYEHDFLNCSYGYRQKRSSHQALKALNNLIMFKAVNHIVEADIKGFFDNVSHEELMKFIRIRIVDTTLLELIKRFIKAGYIDNGLLIKPEKGTAQGSILSPMLSNIFLHYVLDEWFATVLKQQIRGYCDMVRYADDYICVVQYIREAQRIGEALVLRFNEYGLEIHPEKNRTISFGRYEKQNAEAQKRRANTFDFLGFTHYCDTTWKGKFKVGRKTSRKKFIAKCKEMNIWLKAIRNMKKTKEWWQTLKAKMEGHFQYYGISENYSSILNFYRRTMYLVHKWLNRRSQRSRMSWMKFRDYLTRYPLPKPYIRHSFYKLSHELRVS